MTILRDLARDTRAGTMIEFALLAPVFLILLLGVYLLGVHLQNFNAVKSVSADASREIMVSYQRGNNLKTSEMRAVTLAIATSAPYLLASDRLGIAVTQETSSRVTGAEEYNLALTYRFPEIGNVPLDSFSIEYSRPIFVVS